MLKIRLARVGKKNQPSFRIVVQEHTWRPQGKALEIVGYYDPINHKRHLDLDRIKFWIDRGAQPTDAVHNFLVADGFIKGPKRTAHSTHKRGSQQATEATKQDSGEDKKEDKKEETQQQPSSKIDKPEITEDSNKSAHEDAKQDVKG